jgi:hypothetical protein
MTAAVALRSREAKAPVVRSAAEFRDVLDRTLRAVDADDHAMTMFRAASLRARFEFTDLDLALNVSAAEGEALRWKFADDVPWSPRLELEMDSAVANSYLQGRESLAVAIARRLVRCRGHSRVALLYVPALRLVCEPYRRVLTAGYPHLAID